MNELKTTVDSYKSNLAIAEIFALKYGDKIPEYRIRWFSIGSYGVSLEFSADHKREAMLMLLGDVFGRSGWRGELSSSGRTYDWSKEIDGVKIKIADAQALDGPTSFPVSPSQFPLQLV